MDANGVTSLTTAVSIPIMFLIFAIFCLVMAIALVHIARAHATVNQLREQILDQNEAQRARGNRRPMFEATAEQRIGTDEDLEAAVRMGRETFNGANAQPTEARTFSENAEVDDNIPPVAGGDYYRNGR